MVFAKLFIALCFLLTVGVATHSVRAQVVVDKTVATVSDGVKTELVTYSDLLWQLALLPNVPLNPPSAEDLNRALQLQINQRIFALEAQRLPNPVADEDIAAAIKEILSSFTPADFEKRLKTVGFESVSDDNFENIIRKRVLTEKYIDFRFRSFVVITAEDESKYYRDVWLPEFRRRNPNAIVPTIEEARVRLNRDLVENRVAAGIEVFLEEAKRRVAVVVLAELK
jgi:hypothetical protein